MRSINFLSQYYWHSNRARHFNYALGVLGLLFIYIIHCLITLHLNQLLIHARNEKKILLTQRTLVHPVKKQQRTKLVCDAYCLCESQLKRIASLLAPYTALSKFIIVNRIIEFYGTMREPSDFLILQKNMQRNFNLLEARTNSNHQFKIRIEFNNGRSI